MPDHQVLGLVGLERLRHRLGDLDLAERQLRGPPGELDRHEVHRRRADEAGDEQVDRVVVELLRAADLLELALAHHRDPVAERHRLGLVVGDVDGGRLEPVLDPRDLGAHLHAQLRVEVRERLVHQERLRLADDRPAHRDPLALAAGEVRGLAVEVLGEVEDLGRVLDHLVDPGLLDLRHLQRERHVLAHGHVRVERVVLEDHRDVAVLRRLAVDDVVADPQLAVGDVLEPGDHPQRRRLAAAGRADEDQELAVGDVEVELLDGLGPVREPLGHLVERDL